MDRDQYAGMTIPEMKESDAGPEIELVSWKPYERDGEQLVEIGWDMGWTTAIPVRGDTDWVKRVTASEAKAIKARPYGGGMGRAFNGMDVWIDGEWREVFFDTPAEREAKKAKQRAASDREAREAYAKAKPEMDADFGKLPSLFQIRIQKRRDRNPNFRMEYETYEAHCCNQAVVYAEAALAQFTEPHEVTRENLTTVHRLRDDDGELTGEGYTRDEEGFLSSKDTAVAACEWLEGWAAPAYEGAEKPDPEQGKEWKGWGPWNERAKAKDSNEATRKLIPGHDSGHSGNTFAVSVRLAYLYLTNPEGVVKMHGAMAALVGSEDYGDPIDEIEEEPTEAAAPA